MRKRLTDLLPQDFTKFRVWEQIVDDTSPDVEVVALSSYPLTHMSLRYVGGTATDSNGVKVEVMAWNIISGRNDLTEHMVAFSIWGGGAWHMIPRYHDVAYTEDWRSVVESQVGASLCFPLVFNISDLGILGPQCPVTKLVLRHFDKSERKSEDEIMSIAVEWS